MKRMAIADARTTIDQVLRWSAAGIDVVQLREKELDAGAILQVAELWREALWGSATRLVVNGRADIAKASGADGVHLTARKGELTASQVRALMPGAFVSASAHSLSEVERAINGGADLIVFGPVFEKRVDGALVQNGTGLPMLAAACRMAADVPVLALGGVNAVNQHLCLQAGAAGIAGIRLFADLA
ncbi:thiamine phosphate synthase [Granulicella cerasi]|uniref:Thiamine phosphate synthase n=1 Tax=Granulicella cerasi TaxID=741063 RepID=A0ABW1ZDA0_9BACT|nr:thiamine phosphate synthase [Granulicella cerasi]